MERQPIEACSFCGRPGALGFAAMQGSVGICEQCVSDMHTGVREAERHQRDRMSDLFDEWMLLLVPLGIVLTSITMQPDGLGPLWAPLLQAFGAIFLLGSLFYELWGTIVRKQWTPSAVVPLFWAGCGAFIGYAAGLTGILIGGVLGLGVWIGCRLLVKRIKIRRLLTGTRSSPTRH